MIDSLDAALKVLADWRVIAVAAGFVFLVAMLRAVGQVYRSPRLRRRRKAPAKKAAPSTPSVPAPPPPDRSRRPR